MTRWLWRSIKFLFALGLLCFASCVVERQLSFRLDATRAERARETQFFAEGRFQNKLPTEVKFGREQSKNYLDELWSNGAVKEPKRPMPRRTREEILVAHEDASALKITWLGHSSILVSIDNKRFLFDPVWSTRASPVQFAGPKRFSENLIELDALPKLDGVIISHDHYDHLDREAIETLAQLGNSFFVPLGVDQRFEEWGISPTQIFSHVWWQESLLGEHRVIALPARHFSGRALSDHFQTLWVSWAIIGPEHRVFFSGDTGMHPDFKTIGARLGPFDIAMMESGAYNQAWPNVHMGPEQAVDAFFDLKARIFLPIHWGGFNLALHTWTEPVERLVTLAKSRDFDLATPILGETVILGEALPQSRWWPSLKHENARERPIISSHLTSSTAD